MVLVNKTRFTVAKKKKQQVYGMKKELQAMDQVKELILKKQ